MTSQQRAALIRAATDKIDRLEIEIANCEVPEKKRELHLERETLRFAAVALRAQDQVDAQLEIEAIDIFRNYRLLLPAAGKAYFRKLAAYLSWFELERQLK